MNWLYGLYVAIGVGFIIFVHELGHFLVAKACGVKCEKFMIGFDIAGIRLLSFRWGETLYGIGILPLGGYVKMLGQEDNPAALRKEMERARQEAASGQGAAEGPAKADVESAEAKLYNPRSYLAKSVPQRMAIISAGVIMNMIFAFIFAVIAYYFFGVKENPSIVGSVMAGSAAWQAGVRADDRVEEVGGRKVHTFLQMMQEVVNGDTVHGFPLVIRRHGVKEPLEISVKPQDLGGKPTIGVGPAMSLQIAKETDAPVVLPGSSAVGAVPPFLHGDRIIKIDGQPIETYGQLRDFLVVHADRPLQVTVVRTKASADETTKTVATEEVTITVPPSPMKQFGLAMQIGPVAAVQVDSPAASAGIQPGDVLKTVDGAPVDDPLKLPDVIRKRAGAEITLGLERNEKPVEVKVKATSSSRCCQPDLQDSPVALNELGLAYFVLNKVASVATGEPAAKAGIQAGDLLLKARILPPTEEQMKDLRKQYHDDNLNQSEVEVSFSNDARNWPYFLLSPQVGLQYSLPGTTVEFTWRRDGKEMTGKPVPPEPAKDWFYSERGWDFEAIIKVQRAQNFRDAIQMGARKTIDSALVVYRTLHSVGTGKVSPRMVSGPVGIVEMALAVARNGLGDFLVFLTLLSANLAVLNFLPIPVLDGGHMVLLLYEGIRGKPADERVQEVLTWIGLILLLTLMIWAFGLDLRIFSRPGAH
jgi:regulator of sigma E protease